MMRRLLFPLIALTAVLAGSKVRADFTFTSIDVPGAQSTYAAAINDLGQIVGSFCCSAKGFRYDGSTFTTIEIPGACSTSLTAINNSGQMIGRYVESSDCSEGARYDHTFLHDGTLWAVIEAPGATATFAQGINDAGVIVGYYSGASGIHGFSLDGPHSRRSIVPALATRT